MNTKTNYFHFLWLLMALIYFSMANGNAVPVAAWLGPLFFMRFMRKVESKWGLVIAAIGLGFAYVFSLYEPLSNSNISPLMRVLYCFLFALVLVYPSFLVDRFFNKRLQGILNTLVFPAAFVVIEYVNSLISPFSTFGFAAYTQYENLPLIQLSSITGIWGIAFLLMWFSSVVNYVWERGFKWNEIKVPFVAYFSVIIAVLTFGGLRLNQLYDGNLVRVAISSLSYDSRAMFTNAIETGKAPDLAMNMKAFDKFFESTANMRVKIIVWQEYALTVAEADIESLKKYVSNKVKIRGVYCTLPVGIAVKGKNKNQLKNCVYLFGPDGNEIAEYTKSYTAPWETSEKETKEVTVIKTDLAILAMTICFDMDFPSLIRQAGAMNSDIMLAPLLIGEVSCPSIPAWLCSEQLKTDLAWLDQPEI